MIRDKMLLQSLLLLALLQGSAQGLPTDTDSEPLLTVDEAQAAPVDDDHQDPSTMDVPASPCHCPPVVDLEPLIRNQLQEAEWRGEVLRFLSQMVAGQKESAGGQGDVAKLLGTLASQGAQQILDIQNMARHQSLLVENHQALLLQTSRIATLIQDMMKKPPQQT